MFLATSLLYSRKQYDGVEIWEMTAWTSGTATYMDLPEMVIEKTLAEMP